MTHDNKLVPDVSREARSLRAGKVRVVQSDRARTVMVSRTRPRSIATATDPRCINLPSGLIFGEAFDAHFARTGETIPIIALKSGISAETLRSYQRGHSTPTDISREKLEKVLGLPVGHLSASINAVVEAGGAGCGGTIGASTTYAWDGDYLVVTTVTRIPRSSL